MDKKTTEDTAFENKVFFRISKEDANNRIDFFLSKKFKEKSRSYFQYLIEEGFVLINNKKIKKKTYIKENDKIEIFFKSLPQIDLLKENIPLDILFEDDFIISVNKPYNMVVHPGAGNFSKTFVNALLYHCEKIENKNNSIRPGIVHRLDKNTSGALIAAKKEVSHQILTDMFSKRKIHKKYLCICCKKPLKETLSQPIGRDSFNRKKMAAKKNGKEAITHFKIVSENENFSLVLATPITGRTHQIRVHLKYLNSPIIGDDLYGIKKINSTYNIERQMLHAYEIKFLHPIYKNKIEIKAPIPEDFKKCLTLLNLNQNFF